MRNYIFQYFEKGKCNAVFFSKNKKYIKINKNPFLEIINIM